MTLEQRIENLESILLEQKSVLNLEEAANYLSLKKSYLYKLTHRFQIPFYKPNGKNLYFNRHELEKWMLSNKNAKPAGIEKQPVFTAETNHLDDNQTFIYEMSASRNNYRFTIDKSDFDDDHDYNDFIKYVVDSLNKPLEK